MNPSGQGQNRETGAGLSWPPCEAGRGAGLRAGESSGYAMAALLVALAVMAIVMSVALPAWRQANQREKEEELVFRGRQVRARHPAVPATVCRHLSPGRGHARQAEGPPQEVQGPDGRGRRVRDHLPGHLLSVTPGGAGARSIGGSAGIVGGAQRGQGPSFTFDSRSGAVTQGSPSGRTAGPRGGVLGVRSKSTAASIRVYNGATHYNEWQFVFVPAMTGPGQARPGMRGGQGTPGAMPGGMPGGRGPGAGGRGGPGTGGGQGGGPRGMGGQRGGRGPGG